MNSPSTRRRRTRRRPPGAAARGAVRERPAAFAHIAEAAGEPVGFALWFLNFSTWRGVHGIYLEDLYVRPEARGGGHGKALLTELARICVERGYESLEWSVLNWNRPSIEFYEALGARPQDEWTVYRLTDGALRELGKPGSGDSTRARGPVRSRVSGSSR